ncbi:fatty acid CoA ligase family protein [Mariniblastus fucicola]|uniref:Long-chain-fatty-acid--CoA ligase n=1 Tax=Mariniblastus fucicola TaxID=980251 RepID=A0A5B9P2S8_9BACT|nr:fatty acid CoA ligase family protein [Mariniblastus fucicola]QEG20668.1 Long-chain-fatty-acid--CoA ligase [Mariniblastus fucicola]
MNHSNYKTGFDQRIEPWDFSSLHNVGHTLTETAERMPDYLAVAAPRLPGSAAARILRRLTGKNQSQTAQPLPFDTITFGALEKLSNAYANGLRDSGVEKGNRIALMVPPGIQFVACVFALFKTGATIILIDPGMGRDNLVKCLSEANPEGVVGSRLAHSARMIYRRWFPNCKKNFVVGGSFPGCKSMSKFEKSADKEFAPIEMDREDSAAIIFTTGSTGPPKGVHYRHRIFLEQSRQIRDWFDVRPGTVDVSGFPLFALFNSAMGSATVFPDMDPTRPADIFPPNLIHAVETFGADQSFGSPALWNTVSRYCADNDRKLPTIKRILSAGAPVPPHVLKRIKSVIADDGDAWTPYGATESLPVACISATEVLNETAEQSAQGAGTCVGQKFPDMTWNLIPISDDPIPSIDQTTFLPQGEIGELIVQGAVVTDKYLTRGDANADHKVADGEKFWHRMGDVGYFDAEGRFWFCGRKSHRLETETGPMFTVPCESIINSHPSVYRSALVGSGKTGQQVPVIFAELWPEKNPSNETEKAALIQELKDLAGQHWQTDAIKHFAIHDKLPVDIRHNSKIFREKMRPLADQIINQ